MQIILFTGCASDGDIYDNIYNGLQARGVIVNPQIDQRQINKSMSYQEYKAEQKKLKASGQ